MERHCRRLGTDFPNEFGSVENLQRRRWLEGRHAGGDPCRLSSLTEGGRDLHTRCHIPARAGLKVDTWSKVDVACVTSLRLCLHGIYPQRKGHLGAPGVSNGLSKNKLSPSQHDSNKPLSTSFFGVQAPS